MLDYPTALVVACVRDERVFLRTQDHHLRPDAFEEVEQQQVFAVLCQNFSEGIPHNRVELMMRLNGGGR